MTDKEESNIQVVIRVRPISEKEKKNQDYDIIRIEDNLIIILDPIEMEFLNQNQKMLDVYHRSKEQKYAFDKIYRDNNNQQIYEETCRNLISPVMKGYNATVFAYGPTGTGKTYTMIGNLSSPGLMSHTTADIFEYAKNDSNNNYDVKITYVEIYNEVIRDLLVPNSSALDLREDSNKGINIAGVTEYKVENVSSVMNLLLEGNRRRTTEATNANQTSSRSHAVFQIHVSASSRTSNTSKETLLGKLSLIDLAGSERGTVTENRGIRLREGAKINQSLLALANCINALGDKNKKGYFVPYRDSKLTRILKDSLGGNSKTIMINCVAPSSSYFEETINTLKYANRAKNIKTNATANKKLVQRHIAEYKDIISDLRAEIEQLKYKLVNQVNDPSENSMQEAENILPSSKKSQSGDQCVCQRSEDEVELKKIQEEIMQNFQDRIQLRRALMEIEEQNALNILEIKKKTTDVNVFKKTNFPKVADSQQIDKDKIPEEIKQEIRSIRTLKMSTEQNKAKKELMNLQLMENIASAKQIREKIPQRIKHKDKRRILELVIKNHVLDLQNIELEINLQIKDKTIEDMKQIIEQQRKIIQEKTMSEYQNNNAGPNSQIQNGSIINENNYVYENNNDDVDNDLDDLIDNENIDNDYQHELEEEEQELQMDITMYKDKLQKSLVSLQEEKNQQNQRYGNNGNSSSNNNNQIAFEINGQGYNNQNDDQKQQQKKYTGGQKPIQKNQQIKNQNLRDKDLPQGINGMAIQGQGVSNQKQGPQVSKGPTSNINNQNKDSKDKERDLSGLNLKGKNFQQKDTKRK